MVGTGPACPPPAKCSIKPPWYNTTMKRKYRIAAVGFYTEKETHIQLQDQVKPLLDMGWKLLGGPFFGPDKMYQALEMEIDEESKG